MTDAISIRDIATRSQVAKAGGRTKVCLMYKVKTKTYHGVKCADRSLPTMCLMPMERVDSSGKTTLASSKGEHDKSVAVTTSGNKRDSSKMDAE